MADRIFHAGLPRHPRFERARSRQLDERGYISCTTAIAAATATLDKKDAEVALMFCWLARDLLGKSEVYMRALASTKDGKSPRMRVKARNGEPARESRGEPAAKGFREFSSPSRGENTGTHVKP
jgi:hypothetical protein